MKLEVLNGAVTIAAAVIQRSPRELSPPERTELIVQTYADLKAAIQKIEKTELPQGAKSMFSAVTLTRP